MGGLTARLGEDREATQTRLQEVMDLVSGDSKVLQNLQTRLTDLPEKVDELSSLLRESATPETPVLAELARLAAWLDEHKAMLQSVNKKVEFTMLRPAVLEPIFGVRQRCRAPGYRAACSRVELMSSDPPT